MGRGADQHARGAHLILELYRVLGGVRAGALDHIFALCHLPNEPRHLLLAVRRDRARVFACRLDHRLEVRRVLP